MSERVARAIEAEIDGAGPHADPEMLLGLLKAAEIARETSPWVSVEDGFPEPHVPVLAVFRDGIHLAKLTTGRPPRAAPWYIPALRTWDAGATHWMPIPEPPR